MESIYDYRKEGNISLGKRSYMSKEGGRGGDRENGKIKISRIFRSTRKLELEMEKPMSRHSRSQTWAIIYMRKPPTGIRNKGCLQA